MRFPALELLLWGEMRTDDMHGAIQYGLASHRIQPTEQCMMDGTDGYF